MSWEHIRPRCHNHSIPVAHTVIPSQSQHPRGTLSHPAKSLCPRSTRCHCHNHHVPEAHKSHWHNHCPGSTQSTCHKLYYPGHTHSYAVTIIGPQNPRQSMQPRRPQLAIPNSWSKLRSVRGYPTHTSSLTLLPREPGTPSPCAGTVHPLNTVLSPSGQLLNPNTPALSGGSDIAHRPPTKGSPKRSPLDY